MQRVGLINYPAPDVLGFTDEANAFSVRYAEAAPERLLPSAACTRGAPAT